MRIVEEDARTSAIVVAATVYALAMREQMLPRFAAPDLPKPAPAAEPEDRPVPVRPPQTAR